MIVAMSESNSLGKVATWVASPAHQHWDAKVITVRKAEGVRESRGTELKGLKSAVEGLDEWVAQRKVVVRRKRWITPQRRGLNYKDAADVPLTCA
jgi:hypothetical protein